MPVTQPLILLDEVAPDGGVPRRRQHEVATAGGSRRGRWRSVAAWSAVLIVALIAVAETREPPPGPSAATGGTAVPDPTDDPTGDLGLVVRAMPPDEAVAMFSIPDYGFCGDLELQLDGSPVQLRLLVETDAGLLVTFEVPVRTATGSHAVELIGGIPAPKATGACRDSAPHRRTIAVTTVHA